MFIGIFFLFLAAAIGAVMWLVLRMQNQMARDGVVAQGTVTGITTHEVRLPDGGKTTQQMLVLEWQLPDGQPARATMAGDPKRHPVGEVVALRYLPGKPQRAQIEGEKPGKGGVIALGFLGAMFLVLGVMMLFRR